MSVDQDSEYAALSHGELQDEQRVAENLKAEAARLTAVLQSTVKFVTSNSGCDACAALEKALAEVRVWAGSVLEVPS